MIDGLFEQFVKVWWHYNCLFHTTRAPRGGAMVLLGGGGKLPRNCRRQPRKSRKSWKSWWAGEGDSDTFFSDLKKFPQIIIMG